MAAAAAAPTPPIAPASNARRERRADAGTIDVDAVMAHTSPCRRAVAVGTSSCSGRYARCLGIAGLSQACTAARGDRRRLPFREDGERLAARPLRLGGQDLHAAGRELHPELSLA